MARHSPLKIGLSARITHPEVSGVGLRSKTLQVLEQSLLHHSQLISHQLQRKQLLHAQSDLSLLAKA